jgi:mono/diheme cytochrome c family protein
VKTARQWERNVMRVRLSNIVCDLRSWIAGSLIAFLLFIVGGSCLATEQETKRAEETAKTSSSADLVARGKYLVEGVAACGDCHTPRGRGGEPDRARWLEGAPVFLEPARAVPGWPMVAPRLAGLPPGSDAAMISLLTTGIWTNGKPLRQPMPRFHMTRSDAESVLAYLKAL